MSDQNRKTVDATRDPANRLTRKGRRGIRRAPRETRGWLSWDEGGQRVTAEATVLDLSEQGAAVLADRAPAVSQTVWLCPQSSSGAGPAWEARSVAISEVPSGKWLIRIRFATGSAVDAYFGQQQECRLWKRYSSRETRAVLTWIEGSQEKTISCELLNISGGGVAVSTTAEPPRAKSCWFSLETSPPGLDPVESEVQGIALDRSGSTIIRLRFLDLCPMALFDLAVNGLR